MNETDSLVCKMESSLLATRIGKDFCRTVEVKIKFVGAEDGGSNGDAWKSGADYFVEKIFDVLRTEYKLKEIKADIGELKCERVKGDL